MQENFIRKLDQQIEKTEEDKNLQEKWNQETFEEGDIVPGFASKVKIRRNYCFILIALAEKMMKHQGYGSTFGKGDVFSQSFGAGFESGMMKRTKAVDSFKMSDSFGNIGKSKRDRYKI